MSTLLSGLAVMALTGLCIAPFVVLTGLAVSAGSLGPMALLVATEVGVGYGVWRLGLGIAVRRSTGRQPELLERLTRAGS